MNRKIFKVLLVTFLSYVPLVSYAQPCNSMASLEWLLGDWVAKGDKSTTLESWKKVSPLTFEGFGESRSNTANALQGSEALRLVDMGGEIFYLAKPEQNDRPVAFKLTSCSDTSAVFENPAHDFPKKLDYQLGVDHKLMVTVSGDEGQGFKVNFIRRDNN